MFVGLFGSTKATPLAPRGLVALFGPFALWWPDGQSLAWCLETFEANYYAFIGSRLMTDHKVVQKIDLPMLGGSNWG
jgi:hypothetical protein